MCFTPCDSPRNSVVNNKNTVSCPKVRTTRYWCKRRIYCLPGQQLSCGHAGSKPRKNKTYISTEIAVCRKFTLGQLSNSHPTSQHETDFAMVHLYDMDFCYSNIRFLFTCIKLPYFKGMDSDCSLVILPQTGRSQDPNDD